MDQIPYLPKEQQEALLNSPALEAPKHITPNFDNPPNNNTLGYTVAAICTVVASLCFVMRIYARNFRPLQFHIEDGSFCALSLSWNQIHRGKLFFFFFFFG